MKVEGYIKKAGIPYKSVEVYVKGTEIYKTAGAIPGSRG